MTRTPVEGECELCGDPAECPTGHRCEACSGLEERIRSERREVEAATKRRFEHLRKADESTGWTRLRYMALAGVEQSTADAHEYALREARDLLTAREFAHLARLEAAAEAA